MNVKIGDMVTWTEERYGNNDPRKGHVVRFSNGVPYVMESVGSTSVGAALALVKGDRPPAQLLKGTTGVRALRAISGVFGEGSAVGSIAACLAWQEESGNMKLSTAALELVRNGTPSAIWALIRKIERMGLTSEWADIRRAADAILS